jgi:hypothetical protein
MKVIMKRRQPTILLHLEFHGILRTLLVVTVGRLDWGRFDVEVTLCMSFTDIVAVTVNDTYTFYILITGMPILAQRATLCAIESVDRQRYNSGAAESNRR